MLLLLLVVGVFLLFTNGIQGRMRLILIIFCLVVGVYLFFKLPIFKDNNELLSSPQNAKNEYIMRGEELKKTDGPIGLSCWIYIDNWNYNYGKEKSIIYSDNEYFPQISLDAYKNDIHISVKVFNDDNSYTNEQLKLELDNNYVSYDENDDVSCNDNDKIEINDSETDVRCPTGSPEDIVVDNVNIQKWVNILVTFNNRTLDVYMNGKLIKSTPFNNVIMNGGKYDKDVYITRNDGFGGFISKVQYFPYFITPAKAWSVYKGGLGDALESAINKYNLSVSFYEDQVEKKKYFVF